MTNRHSRPFVSLSAKLLVAAAFAALPSFAADPVPESSSGQFTPNYVPPGEPSVVIDSLVVDAEDTSIQWGKFKDSGGTPIPGLSPSFFIFEHNDPIAAGGTFSIGGFTYKNGESEVGSGITAAELSLKILFDTGDMPEFFLHLNILNSPNIDDGDPFDDTDVRASADVVSITDPVKSFMIGSTTYYLSFSFDDPDPDTGFTDAAGLHVFEGESANASLNGSLSLTPPPPTGVPDGGTTLGLLIAGFGSVCLLRRRNK